MAGIRIDRRRLIAMAGAAGLTGLLPAPLKALERGAIAFASAFYTDDRKFGVALLSEAGEVLGRIPLPARGHDVVFDRSGEVAVVFARRPGNFAIGFNVHGRSEPVTFTSPLDRHFYGHGAFSADGRLLFATENDFDNGRGVIGVYRIGDRIERIGEFPSHGIGPHELVLMPDGKTLAIANGGIETHPDYGRTKLNLFDMEPSLVFVDSNTGDLLDRFVLPADLQQLSIRHLSICGDWDVAFAGQFEGPATRNPPLIGHVRRGGWLRFIDIDPAALASLRNYTGSIVSSADGERLAVSSPPGGTVLIVRRSDGLIMRQEQIASARGLAIAGQGFVATSGEGTFSEIGTTVRQSQPGSLLFDNHLALNAAQ